ncbi:hypothetical protein ACHAWO_009936 [Cyclotella atomus]|uniref:Uncharacterized protein n=1 Tax=Cyclotella atomus TaxID=382360 RepID=A0ABD3PHL6_9STRA
MVTLKRWFVEPIARALRWDDELIRTTPMSSHPADSRSMAPSDSSHPKTPQPRNRAHDTTKSCVMSGQQRTGHEESTGNAPLTKLPEDNPPNC